MNPQIQTILDVLTRDAFPYPVAIFRDHDFDLGPIQSVDAFDVPSGLLLAVQERLGELVFPLERTPVLLAGAVHDAESAVRRQRLPEETVWYEPRRTHAQAR